VSSRGPRFRENGRLAQLARAPRLHRGGRWFKSITAHHDRHFPQHGIDQPADLGLSIRRRCLAKYATLVDVDSSTSQSNPDSRISSN
jgi:hypothetical protein